MPVFIEDPVCAGTTVSPGMGEDVIKGFCPLLRFQGQPVSWLPPQALNVIFFVVKNPVLCAVRPGVTC